MVNPIAGRVAEIRQITELLDATAGKPAALIIEGAAGIGKTTLWLDGLQRARRQGIRVLAARASAAESVMAYATLADLLADIDRGLWTNLPDPQQQALASALLGQRDPQAPPVDQRAVGAAFLAVLDMLAVDSPVLLAIDDLQWLDASSALAVTFVARRLADRVSLLCSARIGPAVSSTNWLRLADPDAVRRIRLPPLGFDEIHDVIAARLNRPIGRPRLQWIHEMSGGNPYYALELAREIVSQGSATELALPESLAELTHERINKVTGRARDALLAVASLADPTLDVVARATGVTPRRLVAMLDEAETAEIVAIDGSRVLFTHPLLAHAVRTAESTPRRREMHRRLAEIVAEPELRAKHMALGNPVADPANLQALDLAALTARGRGAPAAAAELLELAISLGGATGPRRIRLAQCFFDSGDPGRARETLEQAIADLPAGPARAEALQLLAIVRLHDDSFPEAAELGRRALDDCVEESGLRVDILVGLAFAELNIGRIEDALSHAHDAVAVAQRLRLSEPLGLALGMRAMLHFMNGDGVTVDELRRAVELENPTAPVPVAIRPSVQKALLMGWAGEFDEAREVLTEVAGRCADGGEEGERIFLAFHLVLFDVWRGDLTGAAETADAAFARARQLGGDGPLFVALTARATVAAYQGRVEVTRRDLADAFAAADRAGYVRMTQSLVTALCFLELSLGDDAAAVTAADPLLPMLQLAPNYGEIVGAAFVPDAAEAMVNLGRYDDAEPLVESLERNGSRLDRAWMLAAGARCRALLLAGRGDVAAALEQAQAALAQLDRITMPFEKARTLLVVGQLQRRLRHPSAATDSLTASLAIFSEIGASLWADKVRAVLARGTAGRRRSEGLTPSEKRVAELAVRGLANDDIASELFVTPKTVRVNLTRIYRKLGIHSRAELYHAMTERDADTD